MVKMHGVQTITTSVGKRKTRAWPLTGRETCSLGAETAARIASCHSGVLITFSACGNLQPFWFAILRGQASKVSTTSVVHESKFMRKPLAA